LNENGRAYPKFIRATFPCQRRDDAARLRVWLANDPARRDVILIAGVFATFVCVARETLRKHDCRFLH